MSLMNILGADQCVAMSLLSQGDFATHTDWDKSGDMKHAGGDMSVTVSDGAQADLQALFEGPLLAGLQVLTPEVNRIMTDNQNQWASHDMTQFSDAGSWLWTYADAADKYWKLDGQYAPMTPGSVYKMVLYNLGQIWSGSWEVRDYGGRQFIIAPGSPMGTPGQSFIITTLPQSPDDEYWFIAPEDTSGGFRFIAYGGPANGQYWDNFELVESGKESIIAGTVFRVLGTGDTTDDALEAAKGSTPAANDLFAITAIGAASSVIYIGNKVAVYSFSADQTSNLSQSAANRSTVGTELKAYLLTYDVVRYIAPDNTVFTVEGFGNGEVLDTITGTGKELLFAAPSGATAESFQIRSTSSGARKGIVTFDNLVIRSVIAEGSTPGKTDADIPWPGYWGGAKAIGGDAVLSAVGKFDPGLTSFILKESDTVYGRFSQIRPTSGIVVGYRIDK